jgi:hypothetical protein
MSNPLVELQKVINPVTVNPLRAVVVEVNGQSIKVRTDSGITRTVWGTAKFGDTVFIEGKSIIGVISRESVNTVYVR